MKKRIFYFLGCCLICIMPILLVWGCFTLIAFEDDDYKVVNDQKAVASDFKKVWTMKFPEGFSSSYIFYNRFCVEGRGFFYAVYESEEPNNEFLTAFSDEFNAEVKMSIIECFNKFDEHSEKYEKLLDRNYLPDFENEFISISYHKGKENSLFIGERNNTADCDAHLYMCYFPGTKMLYIYENIT